MEKKFIFTELYEEYKSLLTDNQSEIFNLYYLCDLSLGEISQLKNISRQGVNDALCKTREILNDYESKLHLLEKRISIKSALERADETTRSEILKILGER